MQFQLVATDFDGTLATKGRVDEATSEALDRLVASGRRVVLVTGRLLHEVRRICPKTNLFSAIVAEDGAVLAVGRDVRALAEPVDLDFVATLRRRGVHPLAVGRVICATWEDNEDVVREVMEESRLDLHLSRNKGSLMILPRGVDKGLGLGIALAELGVAQEATVAVGDAENDLPLFAVAGCTVAVANALPEVKTSADLVTAGRHGDGVRELIDALVADDLSGMLTRRREAAG